MSSSEEEEASSGWGARTLFMFYSFRVLVGARTCQALHSAAGEEESECRRRLAATMRVAVAVLLLLAASMLLETEGREQDFWSGSSVDPHPGAIQDIPNNEVLPAGEPLDRIQVISSAIRVLPRPLRTRSRRSSLQKQTKAKPNKKKQQHEHVKEMKHSKNIPGHSLPRTHVARSLELPPQRHHDQESEGKRHNNKKKAASSQGHGSTKRHKKSEGVSVPLIRRFRREAINSFRRPRDFQFVTNRLDRLPPPPIVRVYPRDEREIDRGYRKAQRRIIYYANLPEIVRPPVQWYPSADYYYDSSRQPSTNIYTPSKSSYPSASENDITRVQSNIIDVTNSRFPSYSSPPKFTIIDVDPPYYTRPPLRYETPNRYYDIRTPPYRDYSHYPSQSFHQEPPLEPVKLQTPPPDYSPSTSSSNSTESPTNTTRFLPDVLPVNLRSLSKFIT